MTPIRVTLIYVALALACSLWFAGCTSAEEAQGLAAEREYANATIAAIDEQINGLKEDLRALTEDPAAEDAEEMTRAMLAWLEEMEADRNRWQTVADQITTKLGQAEDGWDTADALLSVLAGFFPPAAIGAVLVRRGKTAFNAVVDSMAAGGGPSDPEAARLAMSAVPWVKERVTRRRVEIGDKVHVAIRPEEIEGPSNA